MAAFDDEGAPPAQVVSSQSIDQGVTAAVSLMYGNSRNDEQSVRDAAGRARTWAPLPGFEPRPNSSKGCRAAITPKRIVLLNCARRRHRPAAGAIAERELALTRTIVDPPRTSGVEASVGHRVDGTMVGCCFPPHYPDAWR
jgi:hypothetical protein